MGIEKPSTDPEMLHAELMQRFEETQIARAMGAQPASPAATGWDVSAEAPFFQDEAYDERPITGADVLRARESSRIDETVDRP